MRHIQIWLVVVMLSVANITAGVTSELVFTTEESPPYNMLVDGKVAGIATEKVVQMMNRAKLSYRIEMLPWARAYLRAMNTPQTCVFSTTRTSEREAKFKWIGPLAFNSWVLYGLADRNLHLNSLEDARSMRIGTYNSDVRDAYLRSKGFKVDTANNDSLNPRKLLLHRIDLWATGPYEARAQLVANGWSDQIVPILTFNRVELYVACNLNMANDVIDRLNIILQAMNNDGTSTAIERKYENWPH